MTTRTLRRGSVSAARVTAAPGGEQTFGATGALQTFVVPAGITSINVDMYGAAGGPSTYDIGGLGGRVQATLAVTPGETLNVYVGSVGTKNTASNSIGGGGWNGGGGGGLGSPGGGAGCGGGGGASDIRRGGTALSDRKLVAGGGGGASLFDNGLHDGPGGAGGGTTGQSGRMVGSGAGSGAGQTTNGGGGTPSAGGAAGTNQGQSGIVVNATAGASGVGGDGARPGGTGGGGGGYYGGGGGGYSNTNAPYGAGAGGGGSSYADPAATGVTHTQGVRAGDGSVTISW